MPTNQRHFVAQVSWLEQPQKSVPKLVRVSILASALCRTVAVSLDRQIAALIEAKEAWQSDVATPSDSECVVVRKRSNKPVDAV